MPSNNQWVQYSTVQYSSTHLYIYIYIYIYIVWFDCILYSFSYSYNLMHVCLFVCLFTQFFININNLDMPSIKIIVTMTSLQNLKDQQWLLLWIWPKQPAALTNANANYSNYNRNTLSTSDHDDCGGSASNTILNAISSSSSNNTMLDARNSNIMSGIIPIQLNPSTTQSFRQ